MASGTSQALADHQKKDTPQPTYRQGHIVDVGSTKIVVEREGESKKTINVSDLKRLYVDGVPAKVAALEKGMRARLEMTNQGTVLGVHVVGPTITGKLLAINRDQAAIKGGSREGEPVEGKVGGSREQRG